MIIAIDYDMTIGNASRELFQVAKETIGQIKDLGHEVVFWSSRDGDSVAEAIQKLGGSYVRINENSPKIGCDPRKVIADIYIGDQNFGGFPGWENIIAAINQKNFRKKLIKEMSNIKFIQTWNLADF